MRVRDIAVAGMLALALLLTLVRFGDDGNCVVSIVDLDTVIVVALPAAEPAARERAADRREDAIAPVAIEPVATESVAMEPAAIEPVAIEAVTMEAAAVDPVVVAPVAVASLPQLAARLLPGIDFIRGLANGSSGGASRALATVVGIASTYNPFRERPDAAVASTASGEAYDPEAWTAAIQIDLREDFGGVRYGRLYRPTFALLERGDKRAIVRINDVGPLRPGRVIDLNERSMRYFDPTLELGLVHDMKITLLPGERWTPGPVGDDAPIGLASAM